MYDQWNPVLHHLLPDAAPAQELQPGGIRTYAPEDVEIIGEMLGEGAFGVVYKGRLLGSLVAVKELRCVGKEDEFLAEIATHNRIGPSPAVLPLLGVFRRGQSLCLITDFMEDGSLLNKLCIHTCVRKDRSPCVAPDMYTGHGRFGVQGNYHTPACVAARPSPQQLLAYAVQAAAGVLHIHCAGVVHRDIACRNLLVDAGRVRVSDFGLSRALAPAAAVPGGAGAVGHSTANFGPVPWMAPESLATLEYSPASDVYMFGVTLFELFTYGALPWAGLVPLQILERVAAGLTLLPQLPGDIPPAVYVLIEQCTRFDKLQRPSMATVLRTLQDLHNELADEAWSVSPATYASAASGAASSLSYSVPSAGAGTGTGGTASVFLKSLAQPASLVPGAGLVSAALSVGTLMRRRRSWWKWVRAMLAPLATPLLLLCAGAVVGAAVFVLSGLKHEHLAPRANTLAWLAQLYVPDHEKVPPYNPYTDTNLAAITGFRDPEPAFLANVRFWHKVFPTPF